VASPWCNLAASQRRPYCASVNGHSPVGLVSWQWDAVDRACVLCVRRIHSDRASRSASSQCARPFYSSRAGFFGKASHHPGLLATLQPRFGSLRLLVFPKTRILWSWVRNLTHVCVMLLRYSICDVSITWPANPSNDHKFVFQKRILKGTYSV
jgi:hypothetical protein